MVVVTDSMYIIQGVKRRSIHWNSKNAAAWRRVRAELKKRGDRVRFVHIYSHQDQRRAKEGVLGSSLMKRMEQENALFGDQLQWALEGNQKADEMAQEAISMGQSGCIAPSEGMNGVGVIKEDGSEAPWTRNPILERMASCANRELVQKVARDSGKLWPAKEWDRVDKLLWKKEKQSDKMRREMTAHGGEGNVAGKDRRFETGRKGTGDL